MSDKDNSAVGGRHAKIALGLLVIVYIFNFVDRQIISILAEDIKADLGTVSYTHLTLPTKA